MTQNSTANNNGQDTQSWKMRMYLIGAALGSAFGLISAYLFTRSAQENNPSGKPDEIPTGQLVALLLSAMALVRQIAEMGKGKKK